MLMGSGEKSNMNGHFRAAALLGLALVGTFTRAESARPDSAAVTAPVGSPLTVEIPAVAKPALTTDDLTTFFGGLVPYALARGNIAGGIVVVVKNGTLLFAQGYGVADVATHAPVIPDQTLFRPGSVSKLFTWTAVMQLVGEGKLDLDRDVNEYLDFKIPPAFGKPITMRNILTHTPGFEDGFSEIEMDKPEELIPLGTYLARHIPARIFPPGAIVAYSNYGASLAGYIVQRVSGEPFDDYIANHILKPLGMDHSTFKQPLPPSLQSGMSKGYLTASDPPRPFEAVETGPAGALSATGTDMARFMIAHLQDGKFGDTSILKPETAQLMHSPQSRMAANMNGFAFGFYQENRNGLRILGHAGDTTAFHSDLHLLLDQNVGIFMSFNSLGKEGESGKVREAIFRAFLDRYFPYVAPEEPTIADPQHDAARVAGWYQNSRRIDSALRILSALGQQSVVALPDGSIELSALKDFSGTPKHWREIGPLTYREVGGQTHLKFVSDSAGQIQYWISDDFLPVDINQPVHGLGAYSAVKVLLPAFIGILLLTIVIWFGGWLSRRHFHAPLLLTRGQRRWRLASRIAVLILLAVVVGWLGVFMLLTAGDGKIDHWLIALYILGSIGVVACLAIVAASALRVATGPGGWIARSGESLLGLSAVYGLWLIFYYGLANFSLTY
jgi:CubicO group peptidase (beta-lactamase class C family)